jgi:micrococcal nuclease
MSPSRLFVPLVVLLLWPMLAIGENFTGRVVSVSDGDTISVMHDGTAKKIRLHGIDAPEKGQPFSNRAKQFVSQQCFGKDVTVKTHGQDRYGGMIGEVFLPDLRNLNYKLVDEGFAWWCRRCAPESSALERLEKEAREGKRGLWADSDPIPPWEWRKQKVGVVKVTRD